VTSFVADEGKGCRYSLVKRDAAPESRSIGSSSSIRRRAPKFPPLRFPLVAAAVSSSSSLSLRSLSLAYNTSSNASPVVDFFGGIYEVEVDTRSCLRQRHSTDLVIGIAVSEGLFPFRSIFAFFDIDENFC
jgi:hypothetical protein